MTNESLPAEAVAPIRFRLAADADRARLIPLINSAFAVETFFDGTRTDEERLAAMTRKGAVLMAEAAGDGRLLGCVYTEVRPERSDACGYVGMLTVDPAHQRAGLGMRILAAAEEHLRRQGCEAVEIIVLSLRTELPAIYRRYGYIETGTKEFIATRQLKPGAECHCIVLSKRL